MKSKDDPKEESKVANGNKKKKDLIRWGLLIFITVTTLITLILVILFSQTKNVPAGTKKIEDQFVAMRKKWKRNIVGDFDAFPALAEDPQIVAYVKSLSNQAVKIFKDMDKSDHRTRLWPKVSTQTNSADLRTQFLNLAILAKAYGTNGSVYYKNYTILNEIDSGLVFMTALGRYSGENYFGNWWDWQIGIPQEFTTLLMIIGDEIKQDKVATYVSIMHYYLPDPYQQMQGQSQDHLAPLKFLANVNNSGANRVDQAISYLGMGLLIEDSEMIHTAVDSIQDIFELVTEGDGFYQDGSFIQHKYIPHTGSYGNVFVKGVCNILSIVAETQFQLDENTVMQFITNVVYAFLPIVINGETMSFVNGRSITRSYGRDRGMGSVTMYNLLRTSEFANEEQKKMLKQAAKYWIVKNRDYYYYYSRNLYDLLLTKNVLADKEIDTTTKPFLGSHVYGAMDRYVYSEPSLHLGISMYSTRISAFEAGNKENKKGWHLSDGMIYLYNNDLQFGLTYWPTVDWYRLPGTTVDTVPLEDFRNAVVSMQLDKKGWLNNGKATGMNVKAKKSWFVIDGKIISLGTDITGKTSSSIETVIENRLLDPTKFYTFTDQSGNDASNLTDRIVTTNDWFLLKSSEENQSIGYIMLGDQIVKTQQEKRTGTYKEINDRDPRKTVFEETYQKLLINHGNNVVNAQYAYLTYPNATEDKLEALATEQLYNMILANTPDIQAVKDTTNQILGATIWKETGGEIDGIYVNKPVTLLYQQETLQRIKLSISNPKQSSDVIEITISDEITDVITKDEEVTVKNRYTLLVNTTGGLGKTFQITAKVA